MRGVSRLGASALVLHPMGCELASWCLLQEFFQCSIKATTCISSHVQVLYQLKSTVTPSTWYPHHLSTTAANNSSKHDIEHALIHSQSTGVHRQLELRFHRQVPGCVEPRGGMLGACPRLALCCSCGPHLHLVSLSERHRVCVRTRGRGLVLHRVVRAYPLFGRVAIRLPRREVGRDHQVDHEGTVVWGDIRLKISQRVAPFDIPARTLHVRLGAGRACSCRRGYLQCRAVVVLWSTNCTHVRAIAMLMSDGHEFVNVSCSRSKPSPICGLQRSSPKKRGRVTWSLQSVRKLGLRSFVAIKVI